MDNKVIIRGHLCRTVQCTGKLVDYRGTILWLEGESKLMFTFFRTKCTGGYYNNNSHLSIFPSINLQNISWKILILKAWVTLLSVPSTPVIFPLLMRKMMKKRRVKFQILTALMKFKNKVQKVLYNFFIICPNLE